MKKTMQSQTVEDYLKTVYMLEERGGRAKTSVLAAKLGVTSGSVTDMVKRIAMVEPRLIDYIHHRGVKLTPEGRKMALKVIRRHRLLETFLHKILGLGWDEVHQEAEVLEHHLSERVTDAFDHLLGYPQTDPHGEVIPSKNGKVAQVAQTSLSDVDAGHMVRVVRVHPQKDDMLNYLSTMGIGMNTQMNVVQKEPFNGQLTLHLTCAGKQCVRTIGREVADDIFVEVL